MPHAEIKAGREVPDGEYTERSVLNKVLIEGQKHKMQDNTALNGKTAHDMHWKCKSYLHEDLLVLCDGVEGLAGRAVDGQRVVQLHVERHVVDRLAPRARYDPGNGFGGFLALAVRAVELERDKANTNISGDRTSECLTTLKMDQRVVKGT